MRRPRARRATPAVLGMFVLLATAPAGASDLPDWVQRACAPATPDWAVMAPSLVLYDEQVATVEGHGRVVTVTRGAVRILSPAGRPDARYVIPYVRAESEVRDLRAWIVEANGRVTKLRRGDAADVSLAGPSVLYSDARALVLTAPDVPVGGVFAWESVDEARPLLAEWSWWFESDRPALLSRFTLVLPAGLEPEALVAGPGALQPHREGSNWTWEMRDIPARPHEVMAPDIGRTSARIIVSVHGREPAMPGRSSFADWMALARWLDDLSAPQARVTPELAARAASLTAGLKDTLERIRALACDVQRLNYVALELGLGRGWGYRPQAAADVMRAGYGDCKDKANLLRTLLRASGHDAWLMPVYSSDRDLVNERWPSPRQFDHCIVALRVPRSTRMTATFEHPSLGTLLAFDPTDPYTGFGDLPGKEQGSLALLVAPVVGGLVRLPVAPTESSRLERRVDASLDERGRLTATLTERSVGQQAAAERGLWRSLGETEYRAMIERWLTAGGPSINLRTVTTMDDERDGTFRLATAYEAPLFARSGGGLLAFRAGLVTPRFTFTLPDSARKLSIALQAECLVETVTVRMPDGFVLDELPAALHRQSDFAVLDAEWHAEDEVLYFTRAWSVRSLTLPSERYREVREMLGANLGAMQALVVLKRR